MIEAGAGGTVIASARRRAAARGARGASAGRANRLGRAAAGEGAHRARAAGRGAGENCVAGQVWDIGYLGDLSIYKVALDSGFVIKAALANMTRLVERPIGWDDRVWLTWAADAAVVLTR